MNRELIDKLSRLKLEETALKREIEYTFRHTKRREKLFFRLRDVKEEIRKTKFLLRLESVRRKNEHNNTNKPNN